MALCFTTKESVLLASTVATDQKERRAPRLSVFKAKARGGGDFCFFYQKPDCPCCSFSHGTCQCPFHVPRWEPSERSSYLTKGVLHVRLVISKSSRILFFFLRLSWHWYFQWKYLFWVLPLGKVNVFQGVGDARFLPLSSRAGGGTHWCCLSPSLVLILPHVDCSFLLKEVLPLSSFTFHSSHLYFYVGRKKGDNSKTGVICLWAWVKTRSCRLLFFAWQQWLPSELTGFP